MSRSLSQLVRRPKSAFIAKVDSSMLGATRLIYLVSRTRPWVPREPEAKQVSAMTMVQATFVPNPNGYNPIAERIGHAKTRCDPSILTAPHGSHPPRADATAHGGPTNTAESMADGRVPLRYGSTAKHLSVASSPHSQGLKRILAALLASAVFLLPAALAAEESEVVVGVADFPPLVMETEEGLQGFDIDIWNQLALEIGLDSSFRVMPFNELMEAVKNGEVDAAMAGISVRRDRELTMDFSYPYMSSGLRILTAVEEESTWFSVLRSLTSAAQLEVLGSLVAFVLLCSHILYAAERGSAGISKRYLPGIFEATWCILATITTVGYGDIAPRRWLGRVVSAVVMLIGIAVFGVALAQLSAGLMQEALKSDISGPQDLRGRRVATVSGTTSADAAIRYGARLREVERIEEAYHLLASRDVEAVLFDAPPLMRYVVASGNDAVTVVGPLIEKQDYGIAFPAGSELQESVNRALLGLKESGTYHRIYNQWFGPDN